MRILTVPEDTEILRSQSRPVKKIDAELMAFISKLGRTLKNQHNPPAVGLSAIQVGRPVRIFAMLLPSEKAQTKPQLIFYLNPEIVEHSTEMTLGEDINPSNEDLKPDETPKPFLEGCLSIPHVYGPVKRWSWIMAKAIVLSEDQLLSSSKFPAKQDPAPRDKFQISNIRLDALAGRVFQHEIDHLNGILFTDHTVAEGNQLYREINKELEPVEF